MYLVFYLNTFLKWVKGRVGVIKEGKNEEGDE